MRLFILLLQFCTIWRIHAQPECDTTDVTACCRTNREVVILVAEGAENYDDFLFEVGVGILQADKTLVGVVECGDTVRAGLNGFQTTTASALSAANPNDNRLGDCIRTGNDLFDVDSVDKRVMVLITGSSSVSTDGVVNDANDARGSGTELFAVQLCQGNCDEEVAAELKSIVSFPSDVHFSQLDAGIAAAVSSVVAGPLRGDKSVACSIFGEATHIVTFDGSPYDFQGKGEFWLVNSHGGNFNLQVRQEECVPETSTTCATAFAISDGSSTLELRYIMETKRLVIYHNGDELQTNVDEWSVGNFYIQVTGRHIEGEDGEDREGWNVIVIADRGTLKIDFTNHGAMAWIFPRPTDFNSLHGLCGTYDACPENDFFGRDQVERNAMDLQAQYEFGLTWNVAEEETLFRHTVSQRYDFPDWVPLIESTPNEDMADEVCNHLDGFLRHTCGFDVGAFGDNDAPMASMDMLFETCDIWCGLGRLPHGLLDLHACSHICTPDPTQYVNLHAEYVDDQAPPHWLDGAATPEAIFYPSGNVGGKYDIQLEVTNLCEVATKVVIINIECAGDFPLEDISAGDSFDAELEATGYPEVRMDASESALDVFDAANGIREVSFSWAFTELPETVFWYDIPILRHPYDDAEQIPTVIRSEFGDFLMSNETWRYVEDWDSVNSVYDLYDEDLLGRLWNSFSPKIRGNRSPTARWQPQSPGRHRLQFAASDGCQSATGTANVVANCPGCDPVASICLTSGRNQDDCVDQSQVALMWNGNSFTPMHFYAVDYFHGSLGVAQHLAHEWWLEIDREHREEEGGGGDIDYIIQVEIGQRTSEGTDGDTIEYDRAYGNPDDHDDVFGSSWNDDITAGDTQYYQTFNDPPYSYLHVTRQYWRQSHWDVTDIWTSETFSQGTVEDHCIITLDAWDESVDMTDGVSIYVDENGNPPWDCEGTYYLRKDTWDTCQKSNDEVPIVVDCGPDPVPFINCIPEVFFDYSGSPDFGSDRFPVIELDARMSYDLGNLALTYTWTVTAKPDGSEFLNVSRFDNDGDGFHGDIIGFGVQNSVQLDSRRGDYEITLTIDNGCRSHSQSREIKTFCDPPPVARLLINGQDVAGPAVTLDPLYYDGSPDTKVVNIDASNAYSNFGHGIGWSWELMSRPEIDWEAIAQTELEDDINGNQFLIEQWGGDDIDFVAGYMMSVEGDQSPGIFEIQLGIDDECEVGTLDITVELNCETIVRVDAGAKVDMFLDQDGGRVYIRSSSSSFNKFPGAAIDLANFPQRFQWVFLEWPYDGIPPDLDRDGKDIWLKEDIIDPFIGILDPRNPARNLDPDEPNDAQFFYDPITNPNGQYSIIPTRFENGNYDNSPQHETINPSSISDSTSFMPPVVGIYLLKLVAWDGCRYDATRGDEHLIVDVKCQGFIKPVATLPGLTADAVNVYHVEVTDSIYIDGQNDNIGNLLAAAAQWEVITAPEGSGCDLVEVNGCQHDAYFGGNVGDRDSLDVFFEPDEAGDWTIALNLIDSICGVVFIEIDFYVDCTMDPVTITSVASRAPGDEIMWTDGKFDRVEVYGAHQPHLEEDNDEFFFETQVDYWWVITAAPPESTYVPQCYADDENDCQDIETTYIPITNTTYNDDGTTTDFIIDRKTETTSTYYSYVTLAPLQDAARFDEYDKFLACFFPDVPGSYELELNVQIQCGLSTPRTHIVNAACNSPPSVVAECTSCDDDDANTIHLSGNRYARVQLDASDSEDPEAQQVTGEVGDRITYRWDWTEPEVYSEWFMWVTENVVILNNNQPFASFLITHKGLYNVTLWVSDGCETRSSDIVISAECSEYLDMGQDQEREDVSVSYTEVSAVSWLSFDLAPYAPKPFCAQEYSWEVIHYTSEAEEVDYPTPAAPPPSASKESGATLMKPSILMALMICFVVNFF